MAVEFSRGDLVKMNGINNFGVVCGAFLDLDNRLCYFCQVPDISEFMFFVGMASQLTKVGTRPTKLLPPWAISKY